MKILIVEDNMILKGMIEKWLQKAGYEVLTAIDEPGARSILKKHEISLVLGDVRLPEGNGISLLEWIMSCGMEIPFIVMTDYACISDAVRAIKLGAKDYLEKPVPAYFDLKILQREGAERDYSPEELQKVEELDRHITPEEKAELIDTIIVKTQGFIDGNIQEGEQYPVRKFRELLALYKGIDRQKLRENLCEFLKAVMPVCDEYGVNLCIHPDDPPFQVLGLPRIVTSEEDIDWLLNAVDNPHNGLTFCAGSLSSGSQNDTRELARRFARRTHFVHLRSTEILPEGDFRETSHLEGRGHLLELIRIFEKENPGLPMRVDHGRTMLGDEKEGYNPGYSFYGRMFALAQVEGMMAAVRNEMESGLL